MFVKRYYEREYGIKQNGRRLILPNGEVNKVYKATRKKAVEVRYDGPLKATCIQCGVTFLYDPDGRGRHPEYHSNACKQKAYRERQKREIEPTDPNVS